MENILTGDSIFQLTGTHEALFIKIWSQDAGFFCLSVRNSEDCHDLNIPFSSNAGFSYNRSGNVGSQPLLLDSGRLVEYGRKFTHF